ncbi:MAG: laccase domain-containing protein [Planctomycetes bacterium]|nr:laccase domain-containing protein [Planctomycetota bacterium]
MRYLTEPGLAALEVPHGFSVREGGVSEGAWRSLNLGATLGDVPGAVEENLRRLARDVGTEAFFQVRQVHGRRVVQVDVASAPSDFVYPTAQSRRRSANSEKAAGGARIPVSAVS